MKPASFTTDLLVDMIDVPADRARVFDPAAAGALAAIIAVQGLIHPITVRPAGDRYALVSGLLRLRAFEINGAARIPARVRPGMTDDQARLEEVMENLGRAELIALDRCHHLHELKEVWERLHPEAKAGVAGATAKHKKYATAKVLPESDATEIIAVADHASVFGFARAHAEAIGLSERSIRMAVRIWTGLTLKTRARLAGTPWAARQAELAVLSGLAEARQDRVMDLLLSPTPRVFTVADALGLIANGTVFDDTERRFATAQKAFVRLPDPVLDRLVVANEERIVTALKRQGRL